jgi:penicillin-binding protein 2
MKEPKKPFFELFPAFLSGKRRIIKSSKDIEIEPEAQTKDVLEEEVFESKKYLIWFYLVAGLVFLSLFLRLFYLQVVLGEENRKKAEENRLRIRISEAPRGIIYDRNKNPLVKNVASFSVEIYPAELPTKKEDREFVYQRLSQVLNIPVEEIKKAEAKRFSQEVVTLKENLSQEEALLIESKIINLPATKVAKNPQREYITLESGLSHLLGYTGKITEEELKTHPDYGLTASIGKSGLENFYEQYLKGKDGKQQIEVDSLGKVIRILASFKPEPGNSLVLSIDKGLEEQMSKSLKDEILKTKAKGGAAIAINPKTGFILGMTSFPSYDNNLFAKGIKKEDYEKLIQDPQKPMFNRAIAGLYPPGSTIKPVIASAALTEGIINTSTTISDPGIITIVNKYNPSIVYKFPDWKPGGHGSVDIYKALEQSCDVFFYSLGGGWQNIQGLGEKRLTSWLSKFNLGKKTGIDLNGEEEGFIPSASWKEKVKKETWYQGDSYHLAIGQGDLLVTPLQLLHYTMYFANGGTFYKPQIVEKIEDSEGNLIKTFEPEIQEKDLIPKKYLDVVREGMRRAAAQGTARSLSDLPFSSAGKTGTAQNPHGEPHAWFISFAPFEDPQIATVVLLENGGEGSTAAVPVTKDILRYWLSERVKK